MVLRGIQRELRPPRLGFPREHLAKLSSHIRNGENDSGKTWEVSVLAGTSVAL